MSLICPYTNTLISRARMGQRRYSIAASMSLSNDIKMRRGRVRMIDRKQLILSGFREGSPTPWRNQLGVWIVSSGGDAEGNSGRGVRFFDFWF